MSDWLIYRDTVDQHSIVGNLRVKRDVYSPQLDNKRDVFVWLPESYGTSDRHYPVLYMHDGDNLFDKHRSYAGEWQVDETMTALAKEGYEAIVVGLPNMGNDRVTEYNPYKHPKLIELNGRGDDYIEFVVKTIKPLIDADFRTLPDVKNTGIAGSSMGGLISLYGLLKYPEIFGFCGAFSTAYWFGFNGLAKTIAEIATGSGKIYLDVGTKEGSTLDYAKDLYGIDYKDLDAEYVRGVCELRDSLLKKGYTLDDSLMYVEDEGAAHNEPAWAKRLPNALRFLLPKS